MPNFLGNRKPSYGDAYDFISSRFELGNFLVEELKWEYSSWIQTKHPICIYGSSPNPPLTADDVMEPYEAMLNLYRNIILAKLQRTALPAV
jgi:hypothetical protein